MLGEINQLVDIELEEIILLCMYLVKRGNTPEVLYNSVFKVIQVLFDFDSIFKELESLLVDASHHYQLTTMDICVGGYW